MEWKVSSSGPAHIDEKEEMIRALEVIILQESRTELRRLAMQRYLELTEKDNGNG